MQLAFTLHYLSKSMSLDTACSALSGAGFKLLNHTPNSVADANEQLKTLDKYGLSIYQTHAPDCRYNNLDMERHKKNIADYLEITRAVGAKYAIIHGNAFDYDNLTYTSEAALKFNYEVFAPAVETAERYGFKIAFENTFADSLELKQNKPHNCKTPEELIALVDIFGSKSVCACWDTGHGAIANKENQPAAIKQLGTRIECTHIHDNNMVDDHHKTPFEGIIDWKAVMGALKGFTNTEVLCYEHVYNDIPDAEAPDFAEKLVEIGNRLSEM